MQPCSTDRVADARKPCKYAEAADVEWLMLGMCSQVLLVRIAS